MRAKTFTSMGSLHPILFFAVVYVVALLFSIFICSSLFYSCNTSSTSISEKKIEKQAEQPLTGTTIAIR